MSGILCRLGLTRAAVKAAYRACSDMPSDCRIPDMAFANVDVFQRRSDGVWCPKREATLRMSGSQVMHFALHR